MPIVGDGFVSLILPSISVGLFFAGGMARLTRSSLVDVLNQDYIRTARSKGISKYNIILKHSLRNAMIPPVTLLGIQFGLLITGAVITEEVFARPGLGQLLLQDILAKDIPLVQALVVYMTAVYIFLNLIVDFAYGYRSELTRKKKSIMEKFKIIKKILLNKGSAFGGVFLILIVFGAIFAPIIAPMTGMLLIPALISSSWDFIWNRHSW